MAHTHTLRMLSQTMCHLDCCFLREDCFPNIQAPKKLSGLWSHTFLNTTHRREASFQSKSLMVTAAGKEPGKEASFSRHAPLLSFPYPFFMINQKAVFQGRLQAVDGYGMVWRLSLPSAAPVVYITHTHCSSSRAIVYFLLHA